MKLTARQQQYVQSLVHQGVYSIELLPGAVRRAIYRKLEHLKDYETLWSDAERFAHDQWVKQRTEQGQSPLLSMHEQQNLQDRAAQGELRI